MTDSTVPSSHYISTVKALVKMIEQNDELRSQLRDYEDAFEQFVKEAADYENALSWLSTQAIKRGLDDVAAGRVHEAPDWLAEELNADDAADLGRDIRDDDLLPSCPVVHYSVDEPIPYTITEPSPDFSNTAEEPATYSLAEAAAILSRQGIDTGQNKLKKYLNEGICWTDAYGTPRGIAGDYLVETEPANPSRDAVVRITPEGVNELERVLNVAV